MMESISHVSCCDVSVFDKCSPSKSDKTEVVYVDTLFRELDVTSSTGSTVDLRHSISGKSRPEGDFTFQA